MGVWVGVCVGVGVCVCVRVRARVALEVSCRVAVLQMNREERSSRMTIGAALPVQA